MTRERLIRQAGSDADRTGDAMSETTTTLALVVVHGFERRVDRTFRDESSAINWRNRQTRTTSVVELPGFWKVGDTVPMSVRPQLAWFS